MGKLLPSECPNCGHLHQGHDFGNDPGPLQQAIRGLMEIAEIAMPDSYFQTDSRVVAARKALGEDDA